MRLESKSSYIVRLEKSLCISILIFSVLFSISKHYSGSDTGVPELPVEIRLVVEELPPVTTRRKGPEMPNLPVVPIPVEDDLIPEDVTIEDTDFEEADDIPAQAAAGDVVIPEHAVIVKKKTEPPPVSSGYVKLKVFINKFGQVDSVKVVENTTGSVEHEKLAVRRAYSTRYEKEGFKGKARWIERVFNFDS